MDVAILVAYFIVVAVIGVISTRVIRNREDFVMDGRRFGKTLMIFFSFGAGTHADSAVGCNHISLASRASGTSG